MSSELREFKGEDGAVVLRRDRVTALRRPANHFVTAVLIEGHWVWVGEEYATLRDWLFEGTP